MLALLDKEMLLDFYAAAGAFKLAEEPRQGREYPEIVERRGAQVHGNAAQFAERILNF